MKTTKARGFNQRHAAHLFETARDALASNLGYSCAWIAPQSALYEPVSPPDYSIEAMRLNSIAYDTAVLLFRSCPRGVDGLAAYVSTSVQEPTDIGGRVTAAMAGRDKRYWALTIAGETKTPYTSIDDRVRIACVGGQIVKATRTVNRRKRYPVQVDDLETVTRTLTRLVG